MFVHFIRNRVPSQGPTFLPFCIISSTIHSEVLWREHVWGTHWEHYWEPDENPLGELGGNIVGNTLETKPET
jgi:hypothetical protein